MIDITPVIQAIIGLVTALMALFVIPFIKSRTTAAQRVELLAWVDIAVAAAEQLFNSSGAGKEKKQYVIEFLESKGFKVDEAAIDNTIEAAVYGLKTTI